MGTPHEALDTDWQRSAGNFQCLSCKSKRLPAAAFSKAQLGKAQKHPDLAATCKACTQASEAAKQPESTERDGASGAVAADGKHLCSACKEELEASAFAKSQLINKGPGKQRCKVCVGKAEAEEAAANAARRAAAVPTQGGVVGSLVAACQESSQQAKAVTGARIRQSGGSRQVHMKKVEAAKARREAQGK